MRRPGLIVGWAMVAAVVAATLLPPPPALELGEKDKLAHLLAYGVMHANSLGVVLGWSMASLLQRAIIR